MTSLRKQDMFLDTSRTFENQIIWQPCSRNSREQMKRRGRAMESLFDEVGTAANRSHGRDRESFSAPWLSLTDYGCYRQRKTHTLRQPNGKEFDDEVGLALATASPRQSFIASGRKRCERRNLRALNSSFLAYFSPRWKGCVRTVSKRFFSDKVERILSSRQLLFGTVLRRIWEGSKNAMPSGCCSPTAPKSSQQNPSPRCSNERSKLSRQIVVICFPAELKLWLLRLRVFSGKGKEKDSLRLLLRPFFFHPSYGESADVRVKINFDA